MPTDFSAVLDAKNMSMRASLLQRTCQIFLYASARGPLWIYFYWL